MEANWDVYANKWSIKLKDKNGAVITEDYTWLISQNLNNYLHDVRKSKFSNLIENLNSKKVVLESCHFPKLLNLRMMICFKESKFTPQTGRAAMILKIRKLE